MKALFVGVGAGSWKIRGQQIGQALGARVTAIPTLDDFAWADVVVLVKRTIDEWGEKAAASGARVIWDVLDFWQQPSENSLSEAELVRQVDERATRYGVSLVIGATECMASAIRGVYLPHHSRPGLTPSEPRERLSVVAYEGTGKYLGPWRKELEKACARLGVAFVVNPADLRSADLIVSFRGGVWDGDICRQWKSGVKYVNAIAAGRPVISLPHAAFWEIDPPGSLAYEARDLEGAIREWMPVSARTEAYTQCLELAPSYTLRAVAEQYRRLIQAVARKAA